MKTNLICLASFLLVIGCGSSTFQKKESRTSGTDSTASSGNLENGKDDGTLSEEDSKTDENKTAENSEVDALCARMDPAATALKGGDGSESKLEIKCEYRSKTEDGQVEEREKFEQKEETKN
ncbi:MAG: hypothetical protein AB7T49_10695 [Oligoflexales bacterium]